MTENTRKRPVQREHELQKAVFRFVKAAIDLDPDQWVFTAVDAAQQATENQRARAAARGVATGFPDTLLFVGGNVVAVELKQGRNRPTGGQKQLLDRMNCLPGVRTGIAYSVVEYAQILEKYAPLRPNWRLIALDLDLKTSNRIATLEYRRDNPGKVREAKTPPRYTAGKRFVARARKKGIAI